MGSRLLFPISVVFYNGIVQGRQQSLVEFVADHFETQFVESVLETGDSGVQFLLQVGIGRVGYPYGRVYLFILARLDVRRMKLPTVGRTSFVNRTPV